MTDYYFQPNGSDSKFQITDYNPVKNEVKCQGPVGAFIISLEMDPTKELDCRIITEDEEDVKVEELRKELQARVQDRKEAGRSWYGV